MYTGSPINNNYTALQPDIDKFENRYRYLLRTTNLLYERKFQIGLNIFMTGLWIFMIFCIAHAWYSYILAAIILIGIWYITAATAGLRGYIANVSPDEPLLAQMRKRKIVLDQLSKVQMLSIANAILAFVTIWSFRFPERGFDSTALFVGIVIVLIATGAFYQHRRKVWSTRMYLDNIIAILEKE